MSRRWNRVPNRCYNVPLTYDGNILRGGNMNNRDGWRRQGEPELYLGLGIRGMRSRGMGWHTGVHVCTRLYLGPLHIHSSEYEEMVGATLQGNRVGVGRGGGQRAWAMGIGKW